MKALFIILPLIGIAVACIWGYYSLKGIEVEKERIVEYDDTDYQGRPVKRTKKETYTEKNKSKFTQAIINIVLLVASLLILIIVPGSIHQVDAGQVAVVKVWGQATHTRSAGLHFDFWLSHKYEIYDAKVQQVVVETQAYSNDGQTMDIELVVQYQVQDPLKIAVNYGGLDMLENRISTISIEKMKSVLSQKSAMKIIETRAEVSPAVEESIRSSITEDFYISINTVVLTDISFTDTFEKVIEDKMIAEQQKLQAQYEKEKAIIQAEQALEVAKKEAEAKIAQAQGEAKAIEALAQAEANSIKLKSIEIARMLGFEIVETEIKDENDVVIATEYDIDFGTASKEEIKVISDYLKYIEYLNTWSGDLPDVMTDSSASIIIPTV